MEWNSGMVEYWNGGKTTPTNYAVSRPFPISFICHGPEPAFHEAANHSLSVTKVQSA